MKVGDRGELPIRLAAGPRARPKLGPSRVGELGGEERSQEGRDVNAARPLRRLVNRLDRPRPSCAVERLA